jgi:hypothetical protein
MHMEIRVIRDTKTANSVTSVIKLNGVSYFFGLEPANPITAGEYEVWLRWSAKNDRWVLAIMNVPGHTDVEAHIGNWPRDTKDCLLVGMARDVDVIHDSRVAYEQLFTAVLYALPTQRVTIKYVDAYREVAHVEQANA